MPAPLPAGADQRERARFGARELARGQRRGRARARAAVWVRRWNAGRRRCRVVERVGARCVQASGGLFVLEDRHVLHRDEFARPGRAEQQAVGRVRPVRSATVSSPALSSASRPALAASIVAPRKSSRAGRAGYDQDVYAPTVRVSLPRSSRSPQYPEARLVLLEYLVVGGQTRYSTSRISPIRSVRPAAGRAASSPRAKPVLAVGGVHQQVAGCGRRPGPRRRRARSRAACFSAPKRTRCAMLELSEQLGSSHAVGVGLERAVVEHRAVLEDLHQRRAGVGGGSPSTAGRCFLSRSIVRATNVARPSASETAFSGSSRVPSGEAFVTLPVRVGDAWPLVSP